MSRRPCRATWVSVACAILLMGCVSAPPAEPPAEPSGGGPRIAEASASPRSAFEREQRDRARDAARQRRLADAALAWEVLVVLRPDVGEYRERLADVLRQIDSAVAERLPRAALAAQRGDHDGAARQYLAVLALQPHNEMAADALRAIDRERNRRSFLGRYSRFSLARRGSAAGAQMSVDDSLAGSNDVEHAALLAGQGEFDDAITLLERRLVGERSDAAARRLLANVYYRKAEALAPRDRAAAVAALHKSMRLDPAEPHAAARLKQLRSRATVPSAAASGASPG